MKRLGIVAVGLALMVATGTPTTAAAQSPPPAVVFQACSVFYPGSATVTFSWPQTPGALQRWIDLSLFDNGFLPDTFSAVGWDNWAFPTNTYTWDGIMPGLRHFYRVNVLYPDGWVTVASGSFVSIQGCPKPTATWGGERDFQCDGDFVNLTFGWIPGNGDSQWLDLASSPEAMGQDAYQSFGPLSPDTNSLRLRMTNASYWWRVNTHSAAGWSPSPIWSFASVDCVPQASPAVQPTPVPQPPIPPPVSVVPPIDTSHLEWVYLYDDLENYRLIVIRANGEAWLIEYGVGCISMWRYEGHNILIYSPGLFAGIGSRIILPDQGQDCRIWYREYLG
jgi:hypothetical protein